MALQCNIDAQGKRIRLIGGILMSIAAILLIALWAWGSGSMLAWAISLFVLVAGAFMIFEARQGWCVMRAMKFKTKF